MIYVYADCINKEFAFTQDQIETAFHSGDCSEGSRIVAAEVADQFVDVSDSDMIDYLESYCIDDACDRSREDLIMYTVWLLCGELADQSLEYGEDFDHFDQFDTF